MSPAEWPHFTERKHVGREARRGARQVGGLARGGAQVAVPALAHVSAVCLSLVTLSDIETCPHLGGNWCPLVGNPSSRRVSLLGVEAMQPRVTVRYCTHEWHNYKPIPNLRIPESSKRSNA